MENLERENAMLAAIGGLRYTKVDERVNLGWVGILSEYLI